MPRTYYTIAERIDGQWSPQFGGYDRDVVNAELADMREHGQGPLKKNLRIIKSGARQADIDAAIATLNAPAK